MHYMLGVLFSKMHIGVIRPKIRVRNEISRFLEILEFESITSRLRLLDLTPDSSSCAAQLLREHISDRKDAFGKFINSTPPIWDLSRESWDARSDP